MFSFTFFKGGLQRVSNVGQGRQLSELLGILPLTGEVPVQHIQPPIPKRTPARVTMASIVTKLPLMRRSMLVVVSIPEVPGFFCRAKEKGHQLPKEGVPLDHELIALHVARKSRR